MTDERLEEIRGIIEDKGGRSYSLSMAARELVAEVDRLRAAMEIRDWVSVDERPPEELTRAILCIVLIDLPSVQNLAIGTHSAAGGWKLEGWNDGYPPSFTVTHWMGLPPLPKEA